MMSNYVEFPAGGCHSHASMEITAGESQRIRVEFEPSRTDRLPVSDFEFTVPDRVLVVIGGLRLEFTVEQWRVLVAAVEAELPAGVSA